MSSLKSGEPNPDEPLQRAARMVVDDHKELRGVARSLGVSEEHLGKAVWYLKENRQRELLQRAARMVVDDYKELRAVARSLGVVVPRCCDLMLTTSRQSEQGCGRRTILPTTWVHNRQYAGSVVTQKSSMALKIPQRQSQPGDLEVGSGAVAATIGRSCRRLRPALRRRSRAGTSLHARLGGLAVR
jgi:hypothetical protein